MFYIYIMATYTSTLPDDLLKLLELKAKELSIPKNKLIEKALSIYLDQLNRAAYLKSYKEMAKDVDLTEIAEEGMMDYFKQLNDETR